MKRLISGFLFLFFLITVGYCQEKVESRLADYKALAEQCKKAESVSCCMASVRAMEKGQYLLDVGKSVQETACPSGYQPDMMKCMDSYRWCVPVTPMSAEERMDEDAGIKQAALNFFREQATSCAEGEVSVIIKERTNDHAKVTVKCDCGVSCIHFCTFEVDKKSGYWKAADKEYECAVS